MKIAYRNVDEFIADMSELKDLLESGHRNAARDGNRLMLAETEKLLSLFANDSAKLREKVARLQQPDGTVEFKFAEDAAKFMAEMFYK